MPIRTDDYSRYMHEQSGPEHALATYGSLAPGQENHWVVSRLRGEWISASVNGWIFEIGWGPAEGWLGFIRDPDGPHVPLDVLLSDGLAGAWREIDEFEGAGYERRPITVTASDGSRLEAQIYEALPDS